MAQYSRTNLIVNYLPQRLTDDEFRSLFSYVAPVKRAKVCRDKRSGYSFGFGFCEFYKPDDAAKAIQTLNGHRLHHKTLKVAYARLQSAESKNCCLHLTNLPAWVGAEDIRRVLASFGGIISCKILADSQGRSRGIGFCLFETHTAAYQAMEAMNQKPWPDTSEPPIHIRFAHPNEKKVRAPTLQHNQQQQQQQQQQQHQQHQQQHHLQQQQQQQQLLHTQQQHHQQQAYMIQHHQMIQQQQLFCCPDQQQQQHNQHQQLLPQPQQLWGCCQQAPMLSHYPCSHPLMRAALAYPLPSPSVLLPPPLPPPPLPPYLEFRVCATNLSSTLDDIQLYGLFASFGGILEFSIARPETAPVATGAAAESAPASSTSVTAATPPESANASSSAPAPINLITAATASNSGFSGSSSSSSSEEVSSNSCCCSDGAIAAAPPAAAGRTVEGNASDAGEELRDAKKQPQQTLDSELLQQHQILSTSMPYEYSQISQHHLLQQQLQQLQPPLPSQSFCCSIMASVTVYVTFNNYQSAAGAVFSLNGQIVNGQQMQVTMRILEQLQTPESGDLGGAITTFQ